MRAPEPVEDAEAATSEGTAISRLVLLGGALALLGIWQGLSLLMVIAALVVMIFLHELGHYLTAKWAGMKVTEFFLGFGPRIWSFRKGETEYGIKAIPAGAYVRIIGMSNLDDVDPADEARTYRAKPYWRRMSVAVAGSTMHFLMALVLVYVTLVGFGVEERDHWRVESASGPAEAAGMQAGDRITEIDGRPVVEFDDVSGYVRERPGEEVQLTVERDGEPVTLTATLDGRNPETKERVGFLGVRVEYPRQPLGAIEAVGKSAKETAVASWQAVVGIKDLFSPDGVEGYVENLRADDDADPERRVTSIVGVTQVAAEAAEDGWVNVLGILFAINVFIGVFNLTPLLPFDGGHVVIATYEKIRSMIAGRRYYADVAKLLPLTYAVVLVLALLFVTSLYMDISDPVRVR